MAKQTVFTQMDKAIVGVLKGAPDGLTIAELKEATGLDIKSGHVVGAIKKGLIEAIGEREVFRPGTRKVATYVFVTADALNKEDGKAHNYTDNEKALLAVAKDIEGEFTLAELEEHVNYWGTKKVNGVLPILISAKMAGYKNG